MGMLMHSDEETIEEQYSRLTGYRYTGQSREEMAKDVERLAESPWTGVRETARLNGLLADLRSNQDQ